MKAFSANETSSAKSKKGVALTSDYICLQKMKKGTLSHQLAQLFIEFGSGEYTGVYVSSIPILANQPSNTVFTIKMMYS